MMGIHSVGGLDGRERRKRRLCWMGVNEPVSKRSPYRGIRPAPTRAARAANDEIGGLLRMRPMSAPV